MRVLIVDDDADYLTACTTVLTAEGHEVVACTRFEDGRRWLARGCFEGVIADVRLGAFNGLHLLALAPDSMLRVAFTAFPDEVLRREAERIGARLVMKPREWGALAALVDPSGLSQAPVLSTQRPAGGEVRARSTGGSWYAVS
jgi:DNA-binding response OmpR family regulator